MAFSILRETRLSLLVGCNYRYFAINTEYFAGVIIAIIADTK